MAKQLFVNNAIGTLSAPILAADTSIVLQAGEGANFPALSGGDWFYITLVEKVGLDEVDHEIVQVTAVTVDTLTVVRAQDNTPARDWPIDTPAQLRLTAGTLTRLDSEIDIGPGLTTAPIASGTDSIAVGDTSDANAANSIAIGVSTYAAGTESIAIGANADSTGISSIAIGGGNLAATSADATADYAIALGYNTLASALNSVAIGANVESTAADTFVGGTSATNKFTFSAAGMSIPAGTFTANGVAAEMSSNKGVANGYASLDASSKIPIAQLPALAITTTYVVASEAAQLALTVQEGDIAIRTDINNTYIALNANNATMADWQEFLTPPSNASGSGGDAFVYLNDQTVDNDYTIPSGSNGMTAGPITISAGVTVTVSANSVWTVV